MSDLKRYLIIPSDPQEVPNLADLERAEAALGVQLPGDYKAFILLYGTGRIAEFLSIFNPISSNRHINLVRNAVDDPEGCSILKSKFPEHFIYDRFPTPGGLLPWAGNDNGDRFYWRTRGAPNDWSTVVDGRSAGNSIAYAESFSTLLVGWLTGRADLAGLPVLKPDDVGFRPFHPRLT